MGASYKILVVEHDLDYAEEVMQLLKTNRFEIVHVRKVDDAMQQMHTEQFDLCLSALKFTKTSPTGLDLLRKIRAEKLECPTIIMSSYSSIKCAVQALRLGAVDYALKPFSDSYLIHAVNRGINERSIKKENSLLKRNLNDALNTNKVMIGESQSIVELKNLINRVGPCDATVLIQGESGTGKELVAHGIHAASQRNEGRFVPVNCGAIPMELMESEFFGHVKGAYTGAIVEKEGFIREANGGTLFLDEIAELAPILQVKLLRFIQDKIVRPVGDSRSYEVDVRIIAACNKDLQTEVTDGRMREDLFYRLNVIQISVPPLRQRINDIELLLECFIKDYNVKLGRKINKVNDKLLALLKEYDWPGNVRELENSVERAVILAKGEELGINDFKHIKTNGIHKPSNNGGNMANNDPLSIEDYTKSIVRDYQFQYNEIELAKLLGIGRKALWVRRNRWGLFRGRQRESMQA